MVTGKDCISSVLRCSQCISDLRGQCMATAPPPTPCETRGEDTGPVHCMIAKRTDKTGTLVAFSRGCTGVILPTSGCWDQADNTTLCYLICSTDNCNSADTFHTPSFSLLTFITVLSLYNGVNLTVQHGM